eukprot:3484124-Pyramimonas_sp.AAC.1
MRGLLPPTLLGTPPGGARLVRSPAWRGRASSRKIQLVINPGLQGGLKRKAPVTPIPIYNSNSN